MFASPAYLWLLLAAVPLIIFSQFRRKRGRLQVASLMHWTPAEPASASKTEWWRIRLTPPLLLRIAALILFAAAAAEWQIRESRTVVAVVLDSSPSMRLLLPDGRPRLQAARRAAISTLRSLREADRVSVYLSGQWPSVLTSETSPTRAADLLQRYPIETGPRPTAFALRSAAKWLKSYPGAKRSLIYVGDAAMSHWPEIPKDMALSRVLVYGHRPNAAVLDVRARRDPISPAETEVFFRIGQIGYPLGTALKWQLQLNGTVVSRGEATPRPAAATPIHAALRDDGNEGRIQVRLFPDDECQHDNVAECRVPAATRTRVLVQAIAREHPLGQAISSIPGIEAAFDGAPRAPGDQGGTEIALSLSDSWATTESGKPRLVFLRGEGAEKAVRPTLDYWSWEHPVLSGVDLPSLRVDRLSPFGAIAGRGAVQVLARSSEGLWILAEEAEGTRSIGVSFDPADTDFPQRPDFPIFLANAVQWLAGRTPDPQFGGSPDEALEPIRSPLGLDGAGESLRSNSFPFGQPAWALPLLIGMVLLVLAERSSDRRALP